MPAIHAVSTGLALVWVAMWMASLAISGPSSEYLALLDAAKAEGKVAIGGFGFDPKEVTTLEKGFQRRFGFPVKIAHDPTHIRDIPPKVIAGGFDVVEVNVAGGYQILESGRSTRNPMPALLRWSPRTATIAGSAASCGALPMVAE